MSSKSSNEKVSVIGAGNVGSTCAFMLAVNSIADVLLFDKFENIAKAKALDIGQSLVAAGSSSRIWSGKNLSDLKDSKIIVITAGLPRKPGMSRQDLIKTNGQIAKEIAIGVKEYAPNAIVLVVSNPLDIITWLVLKETGFDRFKVIGMAGIVDNSRLRYFAQENTGTSAKEIKSHVLGLHADKMVIPAEHLFFGGKTAQESIDDDRINSLKASTRGAGAQIVNLLGNGSAYYMPGTGAYLMCKVILEDRREIFDVSVYLDGEYGLKDVCLGVPARLGREGIIEIEQLELNSDSKKKLKENADSFRQQIELI